MSIPDFWVHSLLAQTPSPVPSCSSDDSQQHENMFDYALRLAQLQMMWQQPSMLNNFLAMYQLQQKTAPLPLPQQQPIIHQPIPLRPVNILTESSNRKRPLSIPTDHKDEVEKKKKQPRKLGEDTVTNSPVSGMFIKEASALPPPEELQKEADQLDETAAFVNVSEESRKTISAIPNVIGDCVCSLCSVKYDDVFKLAQHKCPRIAHEEYKCPECDKVFSCPANLASHRRWHRPRDSMETHNCATCRQSFPSKKAYRVHQSTCTSLPKPTPINIFPTFLNNISIETA